MQSGLSSIQSSLDESWIWFRWQFPNRSGKKITVVNQTEKSVWKCTQLFYSFYTNHTNIQQLCIQIYKANSWLFGKYIDNFVHFWTDFSDWLRTLILSLHKILSGCNFANDLVLMYKTINNPFLINLDINYWEFLILGRRIESCWLMC